MEEMTELEQIELEQEEETTETPEFAFATVGAVYDDGLSLIFDGETEPSQKHYKCNTSVVFRAGNRVKICADSGTYVVEYVVGNPGGVRGLPAGGSAGQVLKKNSDYNYDTVWGNASADVKGTLPTGGTNGQVLKKSGSADYSAAWGDISGLLPTGGTAGQMLVKTSGTNYATGWSSTAPRATGVVNQSLTTSSFDIQLRTSGNDFQIRYGTNAWKTITVK